MEINMRLKLFFVFNGIRYYSFRKWCIDYHVKYSSARYYVNQFIRDKNELNEFLFEHGDDVLNVILDKYSIESH